MELKPVKTYKNPGYPDKNNIYAANELAMPIPKRWKRNLCSYAAISSLMLFALTGCDRGRTGGTPMAPPSITEEDAYQIIKDEFDGKGMDFTKGGLELKNVEIPFLKHESDKDINCKYKVNIKLDGYCEEKRTGFEYISDEYMDHASAVNKAGGNGIESNGDPIMLKFADTTLGLFYETVDEEALRKQVREFIEWLKAEKVI